MQSFGREVDIFIMFEYFLDHTPYLHIIFCSYDDLDAPEDEVTVIDYRSL